MPENLLVVNAEGPRPGSAHWERRACRVPSAQRARHRRQHLPRPRPLLCCRHAGGVYAWAAARRQGRLPRRGCAGAGGAKLADLDDGRRGRARGTASRLVRSRKRAAAQRKIENLLKPGQELLVQIVKDPIGQKGARVTGYLSLPGRYSVFMPSVDQVGVSRRIDSDKERKRLRDIVNASRPKGCGFIVRTAAEGTADQEIRDDVDYLAKLWEEIGRREDAIRGPGLIYADLDLALRTVRDLLREETTEILIDDEEQYQRVQKFTATFLPRYAERIKRYEGRRPIFDACGIEPALRFRGRRHGRSTPAATWSSTRARRLYRHRRQRRRRVCRPGR
jgi:ribonuclease G